MQSAQPLPTRIALAILVRQVYSGIFSKNFAS
jgi:hypothetical protein